MRAFRREERVRRRSRGRPPAIEQQEAADCSSGDEPSRWCRSLAKLATPVETVDADAFPGYDYRCHVSDGSTKDGGQLLLVTRASRHRADACFNRDSSLFVDGITQRCGLPDSLIRCTRSPGHSVPVILERFELDRLLRDTANTPTVVRSG